MSTAIRARQVPPEAARAAVSATVVVSSEPTCRVCGEPRDPPEARGVLGAVPAELSRRREEARRERDAEVRALPEAALRKLEEGAP